MSADVCVELLRWEFCVGLLATGITVAIASAGVVVLARTLFSYATGLAYTLALRHTLLTAVAAAGVSIEAFVPEGIVGFLRSVVTNFL